MNLHRVTGKADWESVPAEKRTIWQKIAVQTFGIVTPGNVVSAIGLASVPYGLWVILANQQFRYGALVLLIGRLCDLLDGWLADKTGTKSPLGESVDATFDKISIAATVIGLAYAHVITWLMFVLLLAPHAFVTVLAFVAWLRGKGLHPSLTGKISAATLWACLLAFTVLQDYRSSSGSFVLVIQIAMIAYALLFVSIFLGVVAAIGYAAAFKRVFSRAAKQPDAKSAGL